MVWKIRTSLTPLHDLLVFFFHFVKHKICIISQVAFISLLLRISPIPYPSHFSFSPSHVTHTHTGAQICSHIETHTKQQTHTQREIQRETTRCVPPNSAHITYITISSNHLSKLFIIFHFSQP